MASRRDEPRSSGTSGSPRNRITLGLASAVCARIWGKSMSLVRRTTPRSRAYSQICVSGALGGPSSTSEGTRDPPRPDNEPIAASGSCRSAVASTGETDFAALGETRGIGQSFANVLLFKIWKVCQKVAGAATGGHRFNDHAYSYTHAADTRLSAHHRRVNRNSPKLLHAIIIAHGNKPSNSRRACDVLPY